MVAINPVAELTIEGEVATVTINSPPVNALSQAVRDGLKRGVEAAEANGAVKATVIICAGRTFIAGADITEFGKPHAAPYLPDVLDRIESASKPVVAALHGTALGGGFEVALTAHYRIAVPSAKCGLPEIKLGLIPGAGGTQRLPRLIGVEKALDVILSGTPFGAREAKEWGVVDELAEEGRLKESAVGFARRLIAEKAPLKKVRDRSGQARAGAPPSRGLRRHPQSERAQIPRLRGLGESDRVGQERGRPAVRRGDREGAGYVHGAASDDPIEGAAAYLLRRATDGQDRRYRGGRAHATDPQRRRARRRHDGRRHRDEFPLRRHSRHHRRDVEGGARPRRFDHASQLREQREKGPAEHGRGRGADEQAHRLRSTSALSVRPIS